MTFNKSYRIYVGGRMLEYLTLTGCLAEVKYQRVVNGIEHTVYEVIVSYQGEQIVNTEEKEYKADD